MARKDPQRAKAEKRAKKAAKDERRNGPRNRSVGPSRALVSGLAEAEELVDEGFIEDSIEILEELARRYPRRFEVLGMLLDAYLQLNDMSSYLSVCQRLIELDPDSVDASLGLAGAALGNGQMATAQSSIQPGSRPLAGSSGSFAARDVCNVVDEMLEAETTKHGLKLEDSYDLFLLHDEINFHLHQGNYPIAWSVSRNVC